MIKILLIEDDLQDSKMIFEILSAASEPLFQMEHVESMDKTKRFLAKNKVDAILMDLSLPDSHHGLDALQSIQLCAPEVPLIILTGLRDEETAVDSMRKGAQDYLIKGQVNDKMIVRSIRCAIERNKIIKALHKTAFIDDLTGLYNKQGFNNIAEQVRKICSTDKKLILQIVKLERLDEIKLEFGIEKGDEVLSQCANILKETFFDSHIVGRLSQDTFIILFLNESYKNLNIDEYLKEKLESYNKGKQGRYNLLIKSKKIDIRVQDLSSMEEVMEKINLSEESS